MGTQRKGACPSVWGTDGFPEEVRSESKLKDKYELPSPNSERVVSEMHRWLEYWWERRASYPGESQTSFGGTVGRTGV